MFSGACEEPSPAPHLHRIRVRTTGSPVLRPNEETILGRSATLSGTHRSRNRGFSMVELAVSMTVLLILTAMAIPSLMRSFRTYQLNDAAGRVSDQLKFTRFEAIRQNKQISFLMQKPGSSWIVGTDANGNASIDPGERQYVMAGFATLLPAGGSPGPPSPGAIATALGVAVAALKTLSGGPGTVTFDARGAIRVGGSVSTSVFVFYVGSDADPEFGYRAVVLLPSGSVQIWTTPAGGVWQRSS